MSCTAIIPHPGFSKRIYTMPELVALAAERKSVVIPGSNPRFRPAAVVLNMNALQVHGLLRRGLEVYAPKRPRVESKAESDLGHAVETLRRIAMGSPFSTDKMGSIRDAAQAAELTIRIIGKWEGGRP